MSAASVILALEIAVITGVIMSVPYTEIDWQAYMDEVHGFLRGQLDYMKLQGGTGPLVYPGGFVWIYSALFYITRAGTDIALAQWIFAGAYWATLALALSFYYRSGIHKPGRVFASLLLSKRIRSLFVLRLFNDCWAMLIAYLAISVLAERRRRFRWLWGCTLYSLAVSVKMNVFLFAPGLLYVMLRSLAVYKVVLLLGVCALWQLVAGYPFLLYNPHHYLDRAFEMGRVFTQRWSVNFQFLPSEVFVDPRLGHALLAATVVGWFLLWRLRWKHRTYFMASAPPEERRRRSTGSTAGGAGRLMGATAGGEVQELENDTIVYRAVVLTMLESNLMGVIFARSLHYQFYTWFFYSVPYVLYYTKLPGMAALGALVLVRKGFEDYPPTPQSSLMVIAGFALMLVSILFLGSDEGRGEREERKKAMKAEASSTGQAALLEKKAQ